MELGMGVRIGYSRRRKEWPAGCQEVSSIRVLVGKGKESSRELVSDDLSSLCKPSVLNQGGAGVGSC